MNRVLARNYTIEQMKLVSQSIDAESHQDNQSFHVIIGSYV